MIAKRDATLAQEINIMLSQLRGEFYTESQRVMNLGIPLAHLIVYGHVDKVTEGGRLTLQETHGWLVTFLNYQRQGRTVQDALRTTHVPPSNETEESV